ncbi:hypothetical protein GUITHDRAFT_116064 [Guillardia theta CCMP2712]|uniref:Oxidoreductase FAD/NAD(P)-binding domain-containing protein n=1 Tax=Guillardia theta (strain CCMP2712) TaxID=905079 RepID=L1INW5_GUITC|nr:hypothetical protein GUITHDRAFT_116064 [Guillardia theta CCMP2712]EKX37757.1 hypothetical protein GUITHDRAFT_116064 [Guillardia theta CCMP2712]|eukprot:XP_005824737.1 hypothetical protein GUITHDRAFT_116064 [Guillardia theta CCMP2712]
MVAMARAAMVAVLVACLVDLSLAFSLQAQPTLFRHGVRRAFVVRSPPAFRCHTKRTRIGQQKSCPALVYMNAKDEFIPATVVSNEEAASGLYKIMLQVDPAVCTSYKIPGQYLKVRKDSSMEKPGFFAIASPPKADSNVLEFLIKKRLDGRSDFRAGTRYAGVDNVKQVLMFATGSGISPLKAAIESQELSSKNVKLYYGARSAGKNSMAYMDKFADWEKMGVEVIPTLSKPGDKWDGRTGYVQEVCKADGVKDPQSTVALLCGVKGMVDEVKTVLKDAGVPESNILLNF